MPGAQNFGTGGGGADASRLKRAPRSLSVVVDSRRACMEDNRDRGREERAARLKGESRRAPATWTKPSCFPRLADSA